MLRVSSILLRLQRCGVVGPMLDCSSADACSPAPASATACLLFHKADTLQAASYSSSIGPLQAQLDAFLSKSPLKASPGSLCM